MKEMFLAVFTIFQKNPKQSHVALTIFTLARNHSVQCEFFGGSSTIGRQKGGQILSLTVKILKRCMKLVSFSLWKLSLNFNMSFLSQQYYCYIFPPSLSSSLTLMSVWIFENVMLYNVAWDKKILKKEHP